MNVHNALVARLAIGDVTVISENDEKKRLNSS